MHLCSDANLGVTSRTRRGRRHPPVWLNPSGHPSHEPLFPRPGLTPNAGLGRAPQLCPQPWPPWGGGSPAWSSSGHPGDIHIGRPALPAARTGAPWRTARRILSGKNKGGEEMAMTTSYHDSQCSQQSGWFAVPWHCAKQGLGAFGKTPKSVHLLPHTSERQAHRLS
jgi:hypothetical protein